MAPFRNSVARSESPHVFCAVHELTPEFRGGAFVRPRIFKFIAGKKAPFRCGETLSKPLLDLLPLSAEQALRQLLRAPHSNAWP